MSQLSKCFVSLAYTSSDMKEVRELASKNFGKMPLEQADKMAVQQLLNEAVSERQTLSDLIREQSSIVAKKFKKRAVNKVDSLLAALKILGGISMGDKLDITGEDRAFAVGGYNQIFTNKSSQSLKGIIESGSLDDYLPFNMRLESNGMGDDAFDSTEAYDYLSDKIRNGDRVLSYEFELELQALKYEGNAVDDTASSELTEDAINELFTQASHEDGESATNAGIFNADGTDGGIEGRTGSQAGAKSQVVDLLGDNTTNKQAIADAERTKDAKRNSGDSSTDLFTLTGSNSETDKAAAHGAQDLFTEPVPVKAKEALSQTAITPQDSWENNLIKARIYAKDLMDAGILGENNYNFLSAWSDKDLLVQTIKKAVGSQEAKLEVQQFANNKVFTADKVAIARARLKSKLGTLNSGFDPELMLDGMTIAGAYIESGIRSFSAYAKAMIDDFGDGIKPYLLSFYEGTRNYPDIDHHGMSSVEEARTLHQELITPEVLDQASNTVGTVLVKKSTRKEKAAPEDTSGMQLNQDWGVSHIDGYAQSSTGSNQETDYGLKGGLKDDFLADTKKYLTHVSKALTADGFVPYTDKKGKDEKPVSVNIGGTAGSGDVNLVMRKNGVAAYITIGESSLRGIVGNHPQGVAIMIRVGEGADRYASKAGNTWIDPSLTVGELVDAINKKANFAFEHIAKNAQENEDAGINTTKQVSNPDTPSDNGEEFIGRSNSEPLDVGMVKESGETSSGGSIPRVLSGTSGAGAQSASQPSTNELDSGTRKNEDVGDRSSTTNDLNYEITGDDALGKGSLAKKLQGNIAAIKILKDLDAVHGIATPDQRKALAKYIGFGALQTVFDKNTKTFPKEYKELKELLSEKEYAAAKASVLNAYFTSPVVVDGMYSGLARLGFNGGRILEPSLGSGNFFGMMPAAIKNNSNLYGVELDVLTSKLAKYLYPNANISQATAFEKYQAPQGYFDAVIGNPPFGSESITDTDRTEYSGFSIHNYFIAKSIDKLRDGGILSFVVSNAFMDVNATKAREWVAKHANLIGAVRLPNDAFKENAGTEVVTDILYFQKTATPEENPSWVNSVTTSVTNPKTGEETKVNVNQYFIDNAAHVLGNPVAKTTNHGSVYSVDSNGDVAEQLKEFNAKLPQNIYREPMQRVEVIDDSDHTVPDGVKVGSFYADGGAVRQREPDMLGTRRSSIWEAANSKALERMLAMMSLRDSLRLQMRIERDPMEAVAGIEKNRKELNNRYDKFLKEFGYINSPTNRRIFNDDTEAALLQALEFDYDAGVTKARALANGLEEKGPSATKAAILSQRVLFPPSDMINVTNAKDALLSSLNARGRIDMPFMLESYNKTEAEIVEELGDVLYSDPNHGYMTHDAYLSGDVKSKLAEAISAAKDNPAFNRNVEALAKVIPIDKLPSEIFASLGVNWIPKEVYTQFAADITGAPKEAFNFSYVSVAASWLGEMGTTGDIGKMESDYGTNQMTSWECLKLIMNGKTPKIMKSVIENGERKSVTDIEATEAARSKMDKVNEHWNSWVWNDADRADKLANIYNDKHNRIVERSFDGSHLTVAGTSPAITLRPHQKDAVWRAVQDRNVLLDHVVGAGKAQPLDAKILTPNGFKLMGEIHAGDYVISVDGKPTLVEAVFPQGEKEIFKVTFSDGSSTECCNEHLWKTYNYKERGYAQRAIKLGKNWDCAQGNTRELSEIRKSLTARLGAKNHSIPLVSPVQFEERILPIDPYLLGALLGDGSMSTGSVSITSGDSEIIDNCSLSMPDNTQLIRSKHKPDIRCPLFHISNVKQSGFGSNKQKNKVHSALLEMQLIGCKSETKFIPDIYKIASIENRIAIIQGLFDTDGSVSKNGCSTYFYTISNRLANDVTFIINSLGGIVKRTEKQPKYTHNGEKRDGQLCYVLCISLPANIMPFRLTRKVSLVKPKSSYIPVRYIISVESIGYKQAQCIRVAHDSHLYVTDDFIVTHNTMVMAAIAMEYKRLGIARKPIFAVPNHLTLQWRTDFTKLYPASNILAAMPEDFSKDNRKKMFSKMVTGEYDAIIIGHSSLKKIGLPAEVEERMYQEQVDEISEAIEQMKEERGDRGIVRDMEKIKKNLETKVADLKSKAGTKDDVVSFDELGLDALFIDEMHEFKNLFFTTQMQRVSGLGNPKGSGKAIDLFMKIKWMQETYGENAPLITATGTPVSNSLAEMFTMQRYMKYNQMKRDGLNMFDAWAKQFANIENVYEVAPSGVGYRQSTRLSLFKNVPSLIANYKTFADVITMEDLKAQSAAVIDKNTGKPTVFPVPKMKSGKQINVVAPRSELQTNFFGIPKLREDEHGNIMFELDPSKANIEHNENTGKYNLKMPNGFEAFDTLANAELELVSKALTPQTFLDPKSLLGQFANLAQLTKETKGKINALSLTGLANKAGLDFRLIDTHAVDFAGSKINLAVNNIYDTYKQWDSDKGTQIVFCDLSIPLSARADMTSKEKRVYVRDHNGDIIHKAKGTIFTADDNEGFPVYLIKEKSGFDVYEAVSGVKLNPSYQNFESKETARVWFTNFIHNENNHNRIYSLRDTQALDQDQINEYRDDNELEVAEDGSNEISLADLEAMSSNARFSVYDDIKTKLVNAGIQENEIAFIHDYNTPKAKENLFKRVKSGDIRILMGSTPKLGAGTNVQDRLVGLHHIDAPWRPSDLEQREGRIIRQGNLLYARDPDGFEVGIYRYATEQTYDTRRWQLLEHKALGIEQLRKYSGASELEDVTSEAANSADMKAAASGNPLILEETKLRTETKRLISLEKAYVDSKFTMARMIKNNNHDATEKYPSYIEHLTQMKNSAEAAPVPNDPKIVSPISIDGKRLTSRDAALDELAAVTTKVRQSFTATEEKSIVYRGIAFTVSRGFTWGQLKLSSPTGSMHTYGEKDSLSPSGLITRFDNYIDSFAERIEDAQFKIKNALKDNDALKSRVDEPFEYSGKLKETQFKHADVQRRLMKSSILEAVPAVQKDEFTRLINERKQDLKDLGFTQALKENDQDTPLESRGNFEDTKFVNEFIQELAAHDEFFRYPVSESQNLITIMSEVDPSITYIGNSTREDEKSESGADKRSTFKNSKGSEFYIYETPKEVWIDVSRFNEGDRGGAIYAVVGNYAHNAKKVFVGDPQGLSESATIRRTKNMLSLALRFGTTDFMKAADEQVKGNIEKGIEPLKWGNDNYENVLNLIHTFVTTTENQNTEIGGYKYDFTKQQFTDKSGARVGRERFLEGSKRGVSRAARTGEASLRFAILAKSLISSESSKRSTILEQLLSRGSSLVKTGGLNAMFSHSDEVITQETTESIRGAFVKAFGGKAISQLEANNLIQIIATVKDLPAGLVISKTGIAVFAGNKAYFIADRMTAENAHQALLHEIGEHYGLERMLGAEGYDTLMAKVRELKDSDATVKAAWLYVQKNYPSISTDSKNFMHEVLAQIGQNADITARPWYKSVLEAVKRFMIKLGFTGMIKVSDIQDMVLHSLRVASQNGADDSRASTMSALDNLALNSNVADNEFTKAKDQSSVMKLNAGMVDYFNNKDWSNAYEAQNMSDNVNAIAKAASAAFNAVIVAVKPTRPEFDQFVGINYGGTSYININSGYGFINTVGHEIYHQLAKDRPDLHDWLISQAKPYFQDFDTYHDRLNNIIPDGEQKLTVDDAVEELIADATGDALSDTKFLNVLATADPAKFQDLLTYVSKFLQTVSDLLLGKGLSSAKYINDVDALRDLLSKALNAYSSGVGIEDLVSPIFSREQEPLESRGNFMDGINMDTAIPAVKQKFDDIFSTKKTFNSWWHKSVGTQQHKAEVDPEHFGKVYNMSQLFIRDLARYANTAADKSPNLLPKLNSVSDAVKGFGTLFRDEADAKAIANPVFQGTSNNKVYSDEELLNDFNLNPRQIGLYREFRAAIDQSLDDLAISEMGRIAKVEGIPLAPEGSTLDQATEYYKSHYDYDLEQANIAMVDLKDRQLQENEYLKGTSVDFDTEKRVEMLLAMRKRHTQETKDAQNAIDSYAELNRGIAEKSDTINRMKENGYAPLMRFGKYTVDVFMADEKGNAQKDADGEDIRPFFYMFESESESNAVAREMRDLYPDHKVEQGVASQDASSLFKGVTPETFEIIAQMEGDNRSDAFQKYLKMAVNNRSALKRLIERKGTAGFSENPTRVLASFITSNARAAASNDYFGDMLKAVSEIPKHKGDVKDEAIKLVNYIQNPQDENSTMRGLLFMNYLGGSVASALVNMTQPILMTLPYLVQYSPKAAVHLAWAMKVASKKIIGKDFTVSDKALAEALKRAADEGVTSPHEVHNLYGEASHTSGFGNRRWMQNATKLWGGFFSVAEEFNRNATFLASYRIAQENGMSTEEAYQFSKDAVDKTQGVYNKANKPNWARGAIGGTLFTFKQFSVTYIEFLKRLPAKERMIALAILVLASGVQGLPFSDDLDDLIDTLTQSLGLSWNTKEEKLNWLGKLFGKDGAQYVMYGSSNGLPLDLAGRLGAGNLLPATGLLKKSDVDKTRDVTEFFGALGGTAANYMQAFQHIQNGRWSDASVDISPVAIGNVRKGYDMLTTGKAHDAKGRVIGDVTPLDAFIKGIGFNPTHLAQDSRAKHIIMQNSSLYKATQSNINEIWAQGRAENDSSKIASAKAELARWNASNPDALIKANPAAIQRRAKAMQDTANERFIKSAPKPLKAAAMSALND